MIAALLIACSMASPMTADIALRAEVLAFQPRQEDPPGWSDAVDKAAALAQAGRHDEMIALFEGWVQKYPNHLGARMMLAGAHENAAKAALIAGGPGAAAIATKHFEAAVAQGRRSIALAPGDFDIFALLIDNHGRIGLNRPAEYERLVREGLQQHPTEPRAHAYFIDLLARQQAPTRRRGPQRAHAAAEDRRRAVADRRFVVLLREGAVSRGRRGAVARRPPVRRGGGRAGPSRRVHPPPQGGDSRRTAAAESAAETVATSATGPRYRAAVSPRPAMRSARHRQEEYGFARSTGG
jgi:hypothetical protein